MIGAQIGARVSTRLKAEQLRILLAVLVLTVCFKIALDLLLQPSELFSVNPVVLP
ncbi:MAG: Membrane protein [uncultured bacterium]|nr:MAG: Membrane protein [uncultured bacterium]